MKRFLFSAFFLLTALGAARADLLLEVGKATPVTLRIVNHDPDPVKNLRIKMSCTAAWLKVAPPAGVEATREGTARSWRVDKIERGQDNATELTLMVTIASKLDDDSGEAAAPAPAAGDAKGKKEDPKTSPAGRSATVKFLIWKEEDNPGQEKTGRKDAPDKLGVPSWRSWEVEYTVIACYKELAREPSDLEWHLAEARRGSQDNQVSIRIHNKSEFEPLTNVTVVPYAFPGPVKVGKSEAADNVKVENVQGLRVVKKGAYGDFTVHFSVKKDAKLGETSELFFIVRTATLGARPNPWDPVLLVSVAQKSSGLPGNFEAYVYYNLPPAKNQKADKTVDERTWMPVPKGTKITVSQVYQLPGAGGMQKPVEQFIGYGNVIDDKGYFICKVSPAYPNRPPLRFRIVADTIANVMEVKYKDKNQDEIERVVKRAARAAVTPFGKRVFRNISHTFLVKKEEEASVIEKDKKGAKPKKRWFYRAKPGQDGKFVIGRKVLIPYYGYEEVAGRKQKGILIKWEGELSTGGSINFFGPETIRGYDYFQGGTATRYAQEQQLADNLPGLIYHNHNELLHVLSALVRAQEYCGKLDYFRGNLAPIDAKDKDDGEAAAAGAGDQAKPNEKKAPPKLPGVIAYWRKGRGIVGGETGYMKRDDGTWRLVIQANIDDPDERDIGLVLRGYGAAIRRQFFKQEGSPDKEAEATIYKYYQRTSLREAWEQGFDTFFAACVLNNSKIANTYAENARSREERSVDLDGLLIDAGRASGKRRYDAKYRRLRGADNPAAVAAGLWRASQSLSRERLLNQILARKGADIIWLLELCRERDPDLLKDLADLGLCPLVDRWPPTASVTGKVSPDAMKMIWDPNDMVAAGKLQAWLVYGTQGGDPVRLRLKSGKKREPIIFDFGELRNGKEGEAQLSVALRDDEKCFWTVETRIGKGDRGFKWPLQDFTAAMRSRSLRNGGSFYAANAVVNAPPGTSPYNFALDNHSIKSVLGGREVLGGAVYNLRIDAPSPTAPNADRFLKPVKLALFWREGEDPGDATPGIYWLNRATGTWDLVGRKLAGERKVVAMVSRPGAYALMIDRRAPGLDAATDSPDPFPSRLDGVLWTLRANLSEPAAVTVRIEDRAGKVVRTLLKEQPKPQGELTVTWDGKTDAGRRAADGVYAWRVLARDESKQQGKPIAGTVTVHNGDIGSVRGKVTRTVQSDGAPRVEALGTSLAADCEADGGFWLIGIVPGKHTFRFSARGHFDEERAVAVKKAGADTPIPDVPLTHLALKDLRPSSEVFHPNGDGDKDYVSLGFTMLRDCPLDVRVFGDDPDEPVATLKQGARMERGEGVAVWHGLNDEEEPQPSGWYTIRVVAHSRTEAIPQGEVKVLLDRGLVQNANAFPFAFSPNNDGFEDELEIGYNLENAAKVTIAVLGRDGSTVKELVKDAAQEPGWISVKWDGKGKTGELVPDGKYTFEVRPKYPTGHASLVVRRMFAVDARPPEVGEAKPVNGSVIQTGVPVVSAKILSSLDDVDPSQLKIKIDEYTVPADAFDRKTGVFSFTPKTSLGEGVHIAIAYAQDWAGNYAPPQAVSFKVQLGAKDKKFIDRVKPTVFDLRPAKGEIVYTPTPLIVARVRDAETGIDPNNIMIHFNGERVSNAVRMYIPGKSGKSWDWYSYEKSIVLFDPMQGEIRYVPLEPLKGGKNHVSIEVMDKAGNRSAKAEAVFEVVIDKQPPGVAALQPANDETLARPQVTVSAKLADTGKSGLALDTLRLVVDGKAVPVDVAKLFDVKTGVLRVPLAKPLKRDAQHAVQLTVRDRAGNLSEAAVSVFNIVEDGDAPRISVISPAAGTVQPAGRPVLFAAAVYDIGRSGIDPATMEMTLDGKTVPADDRATAAVEGYVLARGLLTRTFRGLARGRHTATLRVKDKAGNPAQEVVWRFEIK